MLGTELDIPMGFVSSYTDQNTIQAIDVRDLFGNFRAIVAKAPPPQIKQIYSQNEFKAVLKDGLRLVIGFSDADSLYDFKSKNNDTINIAVGPERKLFPCKYTLGSDFSGIQIRPYVPEYVPGVDSSEDYDRYAPQIIDNRGRINVSHQYIQENYLNEGVSVGGMSDGSFLPLVGGLKVTIDVETSGILDYIRDNAEHYNFFAPIYLHYKRALRPITYKRVVPTDGSVTQYFELQGSSYKECTQEVSITTVQLPVPRDFVLRIAVASDLHINQRNDALRNWQWDTRDYNNPNWNFRRFLRWADLNAHITVLAGDIIDYLLKDNFRVNGQRIDIGDYSDNNAFWDNFIQHIVLTNTNWDIFKGMLEQRDNELRQAGRNGSLLLLIGGNHEYVPTPTPLKRVSSMEHYKWLNIDQKKAMMWDNSQAPFNLGDEANPPSDWNIPHIPDSFASLVSGVSQVELKYLYHVLAYSQNSFSNFLAGIKGDTSSCFKLLLTFEVGNPIELITAETYWQKQTEEGSDNLLDADCIGVTDEAYQAIISDGLPNRPDLTKIIITHAPFLAVRSEVCGSGARFVRAVVEIDGKNKEFNFWNVVFGGFFDVTPPHAGGYNAGHGVGDRHRRHILEFLSDRAKNNRPTLCVSGHTHEEDVIELERFYKNVEFKSWPMIKYYENGQMIAPAVVTEYAADAVQISTGREIIDGGRVGWPDYPHGLTNYYQTSTDGPLAVSCQMSVDEERRVYPGLANDPQFWDKHSVLNVNTGCLGPLKGTGDATEPGCVIIEIKNGIIVGITRKTISQIAGELEVYRS